MFPWCSHFDPIGGKDPRGSFLRSDWGVTGGIRVSRCWYTRTFTVFGREILFVHEVYETRENQVGGPRGTSVVFIGSPPFRLETGGTNAGLWRDSWDR